MQGDIAARYVYDAWGDIVSVTDANGNAITDQNHVANRNPIRYRGYYYDTESGLYYLNSRYYDPVTCRFINLDNQISSDSDLTGLNLFSYCGNNPVNRADPTGHAWWHWALAAAVVVVAAVAVVATAGGVVAGAAAVGAVASGCAATSTAATVAAGAFIGAATAFGLSAISAATSSKSVSEFNAKGNWGTVAGTAAGAAIGGAGAYVSSKTGGTVKKSVKTIKPKKTVGPAFDPNGSNFQMGVDPHTIIPSKDLSSLSKYRLKMAEKYGREQAITVFRNGVVEDGNHRLANAISHHRPIDIFIVG